MKKEPFKGDSFRRGYMQGYMQGQEKIKSKIGMFRQWLNEKPVNRLVTNKDILFWLEIN